MEKMSNKELLLKAWDKIIEKNKTVNFYPSHISNYYGKEIENYEIFQSSPINKYYFELINFKPENIFSVRLHHDNFPCIDASLTQEEYELYRDKLLVIYKAQEEKKEEKHKAEVMSFINEFVDN